MKKNILTYILFILLLSISCSDKNKTIKRSTLAMGTMMEVQIRGVDEDAANKAIEESFAEFKRLDTLFSTYLIGNEMWRINNSESDTIIINEEVFSVLKRCDEIWRETDGAFDPAIGKLIDIVGFEKDKPALPSPEQIKAALEKVGWKKIKLEEPNVLIKPSHVKISLNACIPGYAADKVSKMLLQKGIKNFLVNAGGEIVAKGSDWKIGIQHPRKQNEILNSILIDGIGVSTSGDYQQYFNKNGKRYSHIFNPVTGLPANSCEAVTIIAKDGLTSDALSTGIFVMGPEKGMELIEKLPGVEALIVDTTGAIHKSSGFGKYLLR
jgi:FAD:protein FMN transferase